MRQRLTVSTGYGVAELVVHAGADIIGKTIGDSGLEERDLQVLTLHRGASVIPNPRRRVVLEAEDRLLCFGRLEEMRSMIPERRRRRAKVRKLPKRPDPHRRLRRPLAYAVRGGPTWTVRCVVVPSGLAAPTVDDGGRLVRAARVLPRLQLGAQPRHLGVGGDHAVLRLGDGVGPGDGAGGGVGEVRIWSTPDAKMRADRPRLRAMSGREPAVTSPGAPVRGRE